MNKIISICSLTICVVFGGLLVSNLFSVGGTQSDTVIPYFTPQDAFYVSRLPLEHKSFASSLATDTIKTIFLDPPMEDAIKKDLGGKSVVISDVSHEFLGSEINSLKILETIPSVKDEVLVEVEICADLTIVDRRILPHAFSHERVSGRMKIHYDRKEDHWNVKFLENVDLQKTVTPNTVAPASPTRVTKYIDY